MSFSQIVQLYTVEQTYCILKVIFLRTVIASDRHEWVNNLECKSNPNPNPNPTVTDHADLTPSIFPSLHSDRRSEPIIIVFLKCMHPFLLHLMLTHRTLQYVTNYNSGSDALLRHNTSHHFHVSIHKRRILIKNLYLLKGWIYCIKVTLLSKNQYCSSAIFLL